MASNRPERLANDKEYNKATGLVKFIVYYLKQIRRLPIQTFIIQTVVTQHHLVRRYAVVTFAAFVSYLELGPPV